MGVTVPVRDAAREAEALPEVLLVDASEFDRRFDELEVAVAQSVRDVRPDVLSDERGDTVREYRALPEFDGEVDTLAIFEEDAMIELLLYGDFEMSALLLPYLLAVEDGDALSEGIMEDETDSDDVIDAESDVLEEARALGESDTVAEVVVLEYREELALTESDDDDEIHDDFDELALVVAVVQIVDDGVRLRALVSVCVCFGDALDPGLAEADEVKMIVDDAEMDEPRRNDDVTERVKLCREDDDTVLVPM